MVGESAMSRESMRSRLGLRTSQLTGTSGATSACAPAGEPLWPTGSFPGGSPPASGSMTVPDPSMGSMQQQFSASAIPGSAEAQNDWQAIKRQVSVPSLSMQRRGSRQGFNVSPRAAELQASRSAASVVAPKSGADKVRTLGWRPGTSSPAFQNGQLRPVLSSAPQAPQTQPQLQPAPGSGCSSSRVSTSPPPMARTASGTPGGPANPNWLGARALPTPPWANGQR